MPVSFRARSLTELLASCVADEPDVPYIYTAVPELKDLQHLTNSQTQRAVDRLCAHYASVPGLLPQKDPETGVPPVRIVGVLTSSSIDETLLEIALAKLGLTALLLSVNNSVPAVARLLLSTSSVHLIYGPKFEETSQQVRQLMESQNSTHLSLIPDKVYPLWGEGGIEQWTGELFPAVLTPEQEERRPAVILHSSGSTSFPKPVYITHYGLIANIALNQNLPALSTLPVFHGYGHFALFRCMYSNQPITLFPGHLPLTAANICAIIDARSAIAKERGEGHSGMRQCFAVPYVIKLMSESEEGVNRLAKFDMVSYAGAPVPDDLGDRLTAAGVNLFSNYGTTETGSLMTSARDFEKDKLWNWVAPLPGVLSYMVMESRGTQKIKAGQEGETFEFVVRDGYPPKIESNRPDGSYATKDLFLQHPEKKNRYRYIGRLDDTLVHSLGEKTNPVPMELCIRGNSPYVLEAIVFGTGQPQTGCLILPSELAEEEGFVNEDGTWKEVELMEKIWPAIGQANAEAPTHSRLLPEMVAFLPRDTVIPVATKMSILRPACYAKFADIISEIYARFDSAAAPLSGGLINFNGDQAMAEAFLLRTIEKTLGFSMTTRATLTADRDLFDFGIDSLQAARIRNVISREVYLAGTTLGMNVVYEHGCIRRLASYLLSLQSGVNASSSELASMNEMVTKWLQKVVHMPSRNSSVLAEPETRVVLLTGVTGSLGAHILNCLVRSEKVTKVITLSRAEHHLDSWRRVEDSLRTRKVDAILQDRVLKGKITSYAGNVNEESLGLTANEYETLQREVTDVIHNAWPVNFVLPLSSYDAHVGGVVNLLNFCLSSNRTSPPRFYFSSSIATRQAGPNPSEAQEGEEQVCGETFSESIETAINTGYARSKWVVEKICQHVQGTSHRGRVIVLRIGQLVGDSVHGVWNETESWPMMFKSVETLKALPELGESLYWLPVDVAGQAVVEIVMSAAHNDLPVYHILNPQKTSWVSILEGLTASGLEFKTVSKLEWLRLLESSLRDAEETGLQVNGLGSMNPAIKLLPFFRTRFSTSVPPMVFVTTGTQTVSPSIQDATCIRKGSVQKWVSAWKRSGFIQ